MKYVQRIVLLVLAILFVGFLEFFESNSIYYSEQHSQKIRDSPQNSYKDFNTFTRRYADIYNFDDLSTITANIVDFYRKTKTVSTVQTSEVHNISESKASDISNSEAHFISVVKTHNVTTGNAHVETSERHVISTREAHNIAFLKVHKSASSTIQNIFLRFGFIRHLTFVLPKPPGHFWRNVISLHDTITSNNILPPPRNKTFNILCNHVLYNRTVFQGIMPKDTKYIGILRNPFDQFESTLYYMPPKEVFNNKTKVDNPVAKYLQKPNAHEPRNPKTSLTNNRMAVEYGFPPELFVTRDKEKINQYIRMLNEEFDLVLIVELIDESLIMMKRLFKWNMKDILYLTSNKKRPDRKKLFAWTPEMRSHFRVWNMIDFELYTFFKSKMLNVISAEGRSFVDEVRHFKSLLQLTKEFCQHGDNSTSSDTLTIPQSEWNFKFVIYKYDCWLMDMYEVAFIDVLRNLQYPSLQRPADDVSNEIIQHFSKILSFHNQNTNLEF